MKHYSEKWKSRAPLPCRQKCPTPAGKQVTLLPTLANLPAVSLLLPSQAGLVAGPPPPCWGFLRRAGGNGATGREVKRQQGLVPGSPSWTVGSTHGSRPSGRQAHSSCLLSERKKTWDGSCQTLSVPCLSSKFLHRSQTARGAGVSVFHWLHLHPPSSKWDVCKQNSGLLPHPGFRTLINLPSWRRNCYLHYSNCGQ